MSTIAEKRITCAVAHAHTHSVPKTPQFWLFLGENLLNENFMFSVRFMLFSVCMFEPSLVKMDEGETETSAYLTKTNNVGFQWH